MPAGSCYSFTLPALHLLMSILATGSLFVVSVHSSQFKQPYKWWPGRDNVKSTRWMNTTNSYLVCLWMFIMLIASSHNCLDWWWLVVTSTCFNWIQMLHCNNCFWWWKFSVFPGTTWCTTVSTNLVCLMCVCSTCFLLGSTYWSLILCSSCCTIDLFTCDNFTLVQLDNISSWWWKSWVWHCAWWSEPEAVRLLWIQMYVTRRWCPTCLRCNVMSL